MLPNFESPTLRDDTPQTSNPKERKLSPNLEVSAELEPSAAADIRGGEQFPRLSMSDSRAVYERSSVSSSEESIESTESIESIAGSLRWKECQLFAGETNDVSICIPMRDDITSRVLAATLDTPEFLVLDTFEGSLGLDILPLSDVGTHLLDIMSRSTTFKLHEKNLNTAVRPALLVLNLKDALDLHR